MKYIHFIMLHSCQFSQSKDLMNTKVTLRWKKKVMGYVFLYGLWNFLRPSTFLRPCVVSHFGPSFFGVVEDKETSLQRNQKPGVHQFEREDFKTSTQSQTEQYCPSIKDYTLHRKISRQEKLRLGDEKQKTTQRNHFRDLDPCRSKSIIALSLLYCNLQSSSRKTTRCYISNHKVLK